MTALRPTRCTCPLCLGPAVRTLATVAGRDYFTCDACGLAFMSPEHFPSADDERRHYGTHQNDPADVRYRAFLSRVADPLVPRLRSGAEGLDYGSGPGPTLSVMLRERGFAVRDYDPFFAPEDDALARTYDFITCTETAEHFHRPAEEFARLDALLRPGGWLAVMTEILDADDRFAAWWYVRDPTHVCFYRRATMDWIARWRGWEAVAPSKNVTLFRKLEAPRV